MLKLARCPHLLIASLATLPSMSLIPFVPLYLARSHSARPLPSRLHRPCRSSRSLHSRAGWLQRSVDDRRSPLPAFVRLSRRLPPTFDFGVTRRRGKQQAMTAHPPWRAGSALARASGFSRWQHHSAAVVAVKSQMPGTFVVRQPQVNNRRLPSGRSAKLLEKCGTIR